MEDGDECNQKMMEANLELLVSQSWWRRSLKRYCSSNWSTEAEEEEEVVTCVTECCNALVFARQLHLIIGYGLDSTGDVMELIVPTRTKVATIGNKAPRWRPLGL